MTSFDNPIVTMAVSSIVFEIQRDVGRKTPIFHTSLPFDLHDRV